jgi:hypothetical protein
MIESVALRFSEDGSLHFKLTWWFMEIGFSFIGYVGGTPWKREGGF